MTWDHGHVLRWREGEGAHVRGGRVGRQALVVARPEAATALAMQLCSPAHGATGPGSDFVACASDFAHIYADRRVFLGSPCRHFAECTQSVQSTTLVDGLAAAGRRCRMLP